MTHVNAKFRKIGPLFQTLKRRNSHTHILWQSHKSAFLS